jgi:hypothetical protein
MHQNIATFYKNALDMPKQLHMPKHLRVHDAHDSNCMPHNCASPQYEGQSLKPHLPTPYPPSKKRRIETAAVLITASKTLALAPLPANIYLLSAKGPC